MIHLKFIQVLMSAMREQLLALIVIKYSNEFRMLKINVKLPSRS